MILIKFVIIGKRRGFSSLLLGLVAQHHFSIHLHLRQLQSRRLDKAQVGITDKLSGKNQKRLLKVVVRLGRDIEIDEILLTMESDLTGLDFSVLDIDFVSTHDDGDIFTNTDEITMPLWYIFVGDTRGDIEHDDGGLSLNVVSIAESSEFFLSGSVPARENQLPSVGVEGERCDLHTQRGQVSLLEFTSLSPKNKQ
jgi:hypothetical protein